MRIAQLTAWVLIGLAFGLVNIDTQLKLDAAFVGLKVLIEAYLLFFGAYQILKPTEVNLHKYDHVVVFRRQSQRFYHLLLLGFVVFIADCFLISHYRNLFSSDTIMAAILLLYYFGQLLYQNKPKVLIGSTEFIYDDFFPKKWPWRKIKQVELEEEHLSIYDGQENFSISLVGEDEVDPLQTGVELAAQVLDGSIHFIDDASNFRTLIKESAQKHGFQLDIDEEGQ